jgi:hypothetical protein
MHVYLSPHHDDVCFSIGNLAGRQHGHLVNVFTRSTYVAAPMELSSDPEIRIAAVTALRRSEDLKFVHAAGLDRHDFGLSEPRLQGFTPFELSGIKDEVDQLSASLVPFLLELLPNDASREPHTLYCPMGIGGHRNHVSIMLTVRRAYRALSRRYSIFLYEDLHYASNAAARREGLARAKRVFAGTDLSGLLISMDLKAAQTKLAWIGLYASQHSRPPTMKNFTPASGANSGPHEMIWRVSPAAAVQE